MVGHESFCFDIIISRFMRIAGLGKFVDVIFLNLILLLGFKKIAGSGTLVDVMLFPSN